MNSAEKYVPRYTVDDYRLWEGDWELWDGLAVSMSPSPFANHGQCLVNVASLLSNALKAIPPCREIAHVVAEVDWNISRFTVVRPDISVLCGGLPDKHITLPPAIVVEIISSSTRDRDLDYKRSLYQSLAVPYYVIADPGKKTFTQLLLQDGVFKEITSGPVANQTTAEFTICGDCTFEISIAEIFA